MSRIAIVGVGAIGGVLAAELTLTGNHTLVLCSRRPLPSLTVNMLHGQVQVSAQNFTNPVEASPVDWVLVATKAYDAPGAAAWFPALCREGATVAILQNGVEHRERFAPYIDPARILPVIIDCPAERRDDGSYHQRRAADMYVQNDEAGRAFADLFSGSRAQLHVLEDFLTAAWTKLCINAPGALSAITGLPAFVLKREPMLSAALDTVHECIAVAHAEGARLAPDILEQTTARIHSALDDSVNSMLADRLAGRPMEIDARNGAIVRLGAKHGIATPANRMAVAILSALQQQPSVK